MANLKVTLELDDQGYLRNIRAADAATKQFADNAEKQLNKTDVAFSKLNLRAREVTGNFVKLGAAIAGTAFVALSRSVIGAADAVMDLSDSTEFSIGKIYELQHALQYAGGESANTAKVLQEFYKSVDEAAKGSDRTQEALAKMGIGFRDLESLSVEQLFDRAVKGLAAIQDPVERSTAAIAIFGKGIASVNPAALATELQNLRGQFEEQVRATREAAELTGAYEQAVNNLRMTFLKAIEPLIRMTNQLLASQETIESIIKWVKILGVVVASVFAFTAIGGAVRLLGTIGRGFAALVSIVKDVGKAISLNMFQPMSNFMKLLRGVGGLVAGIVGGTAAYNALFGESAPEITAGRGGAEFAATDPRRLDLVEESKKRNIEVGKELQNQLNSVRQIADNYADIVAKNQQRLALEDAMAGMTQEQQALYKGIADINERANAAIAQLEQKRQGAKGATLALIQNEIAAVNKLREEDIAGFVVANERVFARKREEQAIKNIITAMEEQQKFNEEMAAYLQQVDTARVAAWDQVNALRESTQLESQREQLERSIATLRASDATTIRQIFDLEQQRKSQLEAIAKIANLPYAERLAREKEINDVIDARRQAIEANTAATQLEQTNFITGWDRAFETWRNNLKTDAEYAAAQFSTLTKGFEDAIVRFVQTGKLSFKSLFQSLISEAVRASANRLLLSIFGMAGGSGGGFFGSLFGGFRANGGPVNAGQAYVVGERGPELFMPKSAGAIIPNNAVIGGAAPSVQTTTVNYNIQAVDASSFRSLVARDPEFIYSVTEQGRRQLPIRSRR